MEEDLLVYDREYPLPHQVLDHGYVFACGGGVKRSAGGGEVLGAEGDFGQGVPQNCC